MPVIINERLRNPFEPLPGSHSAIDIARAEHQDIRPLDFLVVNLMAEKEKTARLLSECLGETPLQVNLTFATTDSWVDEIESGRQPRNDDLQFIRQFIHPFREVKDIKYDGFVLTGFNAREKFVDLEALYGEAAKIIDRMTHNATSSLYLCYGAKAALLHRHRIPSWQKLNGEKRFGVFDFTLGPDQDETGLLRNFPDVFPIPVGRMKSPDAGKIYRNPKLKVLADSVDTGPGIIVETERDYKGELYPKHVYLLPHPENDGEGMHYEYDRDRKAGVKIPFPKGLYRNDDPAQGTINSWRHTGGVYTNWVHAVYDATPFDRSEISGTIRPSRTRELIHA